MPEYSGHFSPSGITGQYVKTFCLLLLDGAGAVEARSAAEDRMEPTADPSSARNRELPDFNRHHAEAERPSSPWESP